MPIFSPKIHHDIQDSVCVQTVYYSMKGEILGVIRIMLDVSLVTELI